VSALSGAPAQAQTTTAITLDFDVTYAASANENHYSGTGSIHPFGNATLQAVQTFSSAGSPIMSTFTVSSGDSFSATSPGGTINGSECAVTFTIAGGTGFFANATGSFTFNYACSPSSSTTGSFHVSGNGSVTTESSGKLSLAPATLTFSFLQGAPPSSSQPVFLSNESPLAATFSASTGGQSWLSVTPVTGNVSPFSTATLMATATATGLAPDTYAGTVTVNAGGQNFVVAITLTVSATQQNLILSKSGLQFRGAAGAGPPPSQSIVVLNQGTDSLQWTATVFTPIGKWLSVNPPSGAAGGTANVTADPTNLQPGDYYGLIQFASPGAANSPQTAVVVFHVFPGNCFPASCAAGSVPILVQPTGLIFVASQGAANTPSQTVSVTNSSNEAVSVSATATSPQSGVFSTSLANATVSSSSPAQFVISVNVSGLAPGVYPGDLEIQFNDGSTQEVALLAIVTPAASSAEKRSSVRNRVTSSACAPTKWLPVSTGLSQSFNVTAAWPTPLELTIVDDCGSLMAAGDVVASFSTGDPPLQLTALGAGNWSATWEPRYTATPTSVVITVTAQSEQPALSGEALISGQLQPNMITPAIYSKGVVSTASFARDAPLAPGAFASIFGTNLAAYTMLAGALPLTSQLAETQVLVAGRFLPIQYASDGQLNVLVPFDVPPNSTQQLIVQAGPAFSTPEPITIAPAQPAVFTQDQSGHGPGAITVVKPNGSQFPADQSHPASAGDALVIYCSGLGIVNSQVEAGSAAPQSPPARIAGEITVTIGGQNAPVSFAGLTPGYAGLYQVNVTVPSGVTPSASVPVLITAGALSSPPVTIAIK
jgi:adhesin/invasin